MDALAGGRGNGAAEEATRSQHSLQCLHSHAGEKGATEMKSGFRLPPHVETGEPVPSVEIRSSRRLCRSGANHSPRLQRTLHTSTGREPQDDPLISALGLGLIVVIRVYGGNKASASPGSKGSQSFRVATDSYVQGASDSCATTGPGGVEMGGDCMYYRVRGLRLGGIDVSGRTVP